MGIEKNSSTPIYLQLKKKLKNAIFSGQFQDGEAIPSESQLADKYEITRTTVRAAINELVNENILRKEHGKGTFVCLKPVAYSMTNFGSFTEYAKKKDKKPVSKILEAGTVNTGDEPRFKLKRARGIEVDGQVHYLTVDTSLISLTIFPGIAEYDFEIRSLYQIMREAYHIVPDRAELSVTPCRADEVMGDLFQVEKDHPLIMAGGRVCTRDNRFIEELEVVYGPKVDFKLVTKVDPSP
ncbi:GntR family transcriptional regulator [Desulfospira joergensenii]|uniref:GntR family transcriptional regulator n=1 Tax=Desulfospira joergensenii TaxID=53329 RepID=UPI0003B51FAC|nr:GntR family transcriptional regulator [Desulfospira joergensenii]